MRKVKLLFVRELARAPNLAEAAGANCDETWKLAGEKQRSRRAKPTTNWTPSDICRTLFTRQVEFPRGKFKLRLTSLPRTRGNLNANLGVINKSSTGQPLHHLAGAQKIWRC